MNASTSAWLVAVFSAPVLAAGSPEQGHAWTTDPPATGALAVHAGDRVVTGRVASATSEDVIIESDLGGTERVVLPSSGSPPLQAGELVSAAYHMNGSVRQADKIVLGDVHAQIASTTSAGGTGSGQTKQ